MSCYLATIGYSQAAVLVVLAALGVWSVVATIRTHLPWSALRTWGLLAARLATLAAVAAWCLNVTVPYSRASSKFELIVLADRSQSVSPAAQQAIEQWIARARQTVESLGATMQVIDVAGDAGRSTPLAEAIDKARASFSGAAQKRILLLSDGRGTTGELSALAPMLKNEQIVVHAMSLSPLSGEALISELRLPSAAWQAVPTPLEVVLSADKAATAAGPAKLTVLVDGQQKAQKDVQLAKGLTTVELPITFDKEGLHQVHVRATFAADNLDWNNTASALVNVPLAPRVVIISDTPANSAALQSALQANGLFVSLISSKSIPNQFACDCIVLDNVPAEALGAERMKAMESFVREGGAIIFGGGPKSFGAGGYAGTPLESVFPVLLTPNKEHPPYALIVVLDNSWSMNEAVSSNIAKVELAKEIAISAMEGLNKGDYLALISFDSDYHNIIPVTKVEDLEPAKYEVSRIGAFGMTNILGGLLEARRILPGIDAMYKHILLITDGKETESSDYSRLLADLENNKVTISTIGVGLSPDAKLLNTLAYAGKGRYFHAKSLSEVPSVVLQEAKNLEDQLSVSAPLPVKKLEDDPAFAGIDVATMPPLLGYSRARMRIHAWNPLAISRKNDPLLARMRYGRGQSLAFTSSPGQPWAKNWIESKPAEYATFWRQAVLSVLSPPHRPLRSQMQYQAGQGMLYIEGMQPAQVTRLAGEKVETQEFNGSQNSLAIDQSDALLVATIPTAGKPTESCSWSRTYRLEFGDAVKAAADMKSLCEATGGTLDSQDEAPLAKAETVVQKQILPSTWLLVACLLLVTELMIRRGPAVVGVFAKGRWRGH